MVKAALTRFRRALTPANQQLKSPAHGHPRNHHPAGQAVAARLQAGREGRRRRSASSSTTCSRPCTTRPASGSRRSRSASRSALDHHGSRQEGRGRRDQAAAARLHQSGDHLVVRTRCRSTRKAASRSRNITRRSSGRRRCGCASSISTARSTRRGRGPVRDLHPARDRPPQRRAVHRSHLQAEARPRHQEIHQGRQTRGGVASDLQQSRSRSDFDRMPLRLIFMGTPDFAVPTLLELVAAGHEIAAVYTRAPKPGRPRHGAAADAGRAGGAAARHSRADAGDAEDAGSARANFARTTPMRRWSSPMA